MVKLSGSSHVFRCHGIFRNMLPDEYEARLSEKPVGRKRSVSEFVKQIGICICLGAREVNAYQHDQLSDHVSRIVEMLEFLKCLVTRDKGGGSSVRLLMPNPPDIKSWEDWFIYYQFEIGQGVHYSNPSEALKEIKEAIEHYTNVSNALLEGRMEFDDLIRKVKGYGGM